jgi:hypothetical protein
MAFPKHHGIELAKNSWFANLVLEPLSSDPVPLSAGRAWHNTTEKAFKFSLLDGTGAVIVRTIYSKEDALDAISSLQSALTAETAARTAADSAEATARAAAIATLTQALADETAARITGDADEAASRLSGDQAEAAARTAAIAVAAQNAADALATETTARLAGDAAGNTRMDGIQAELDATQAGAGLNVDGTFTAPENTSYLDEATSLKDIGVKLDAAITAEVARATAQEVALASALANEAQLRVDGDANLQSQLTAWVNTQLEGNEASDAAETAARIAADSALQAELDQTQASIGLNTDGTMGSLDATNFMQGKTTVFAAAFALDTQLKVVTDAIAAESLARATADTNFFDQLTTESAARDAADIAQQQEINTIEAGAGLESDGTYAAPTGSNYLNAATSLKDADLKLDSALKAVSNRVGVLETTAIPDLQAQITAEVTRATAAEAANATAISTNASAATAATAAETSRAEAAEAALQSDIDDEVAARTSAVTTLTNAVSAEVTRATAAEQANATAIASEVSRAQGAEASLQSQIDAIEAAAGEGAAALETKLNNRLYAFKAPVAQSAYEIAHGLNTEFYAVSVMVEGADGVYRNDIVPVEEKTTDPLNTLVITLTEARKIKVVVEDKSPIV